MNNKLSKEQKNNSRNNGKKKRRNKRNNKLSKEQKIKYLLDLFKRSDEEYVDDVFQVLLREDLTFLPNMLGDEDGDALKTMIEIGDIE